jgi:hypothetical protein
LEFKKPTIMNHEVLTSSFQRTKNVTSKKLLLLAISYQLLAISYLSAQAGYINTVAGNGGKGYNGDNIQATAAEFYIPGCVALDTSGNFYVCDQNNDRIRKITVSTGIITTIAGSGNSGFYGDGGQATAAEMRTIPTIFTFPIMPMPVLGK